MAYLYGDWCLVYERSSRENGRIRYQKNIYEERFESREVANRCLVNQEYRSHYDEKTGIFSFSKHCWSQWGGFNEVVAVVLFKELKEFQAIDEVRDR